MLAISQAQKHFNYLHWIDSKDGLLVKDYGSVNLPDYTKFTAESFNNVIELIRTEIELDSPVFTLTLDSAELMFSELQANENVEFEATLAWNIKQSQDDKFSKFMDTYHYPFLKSTQKYLNIHLPKSIKPSLQESMAFLKGEMRALGIGIFSAENCARLFFKAGALSSYIIWKIGANGISEVLSLKNGELSSYFRFERTEEDYKLPLFLGNQTNVQNIIMEMIAYLNGKLEEFTVADRLFVYQVGDESIDIKQLINANIPKITLLSPLRKLKLDSEKPVDPYSTSFLAEAGIAFRGIDV